MNSINLSETLTNKTENQTPQVVEVAYCLNLSHCLSGNQQSECKRSKPLLQSRKLHALPHQQCVFWRCYKRHYYKHADHHLYGDYLCNICLRSGAGNTNLSICSQRRRSYAIHHPYHVVFGWTGDHLSPASSTL